jgi:chaperonin GroES
MPMDSTGQDYQTQTDSNLQSWKSPKIQFSKLRDSNNIAPMLEQETLDAIGLQVVTGYRQDKSSRKEWEERMSKAIKLALQVVEQKNFPWVNASNVKFPLVTIAALQFLSRVALLTKGQNLVKCDVMGADMGGAKYAKGSRISRHMSFQMVEEDPDWVDNDEKVKLATAIMGCAFKKTYWDFVTGQLPGEYVPAQNLVVDYYTTSFDKAQRITHWMPMTDNELQERFRSGVFLKVDSKLTGLTLPDTLAAAKDESQGTYASGDMAIMPYGILEQHTWLDLDGDGYKEPYIVVVKEDSGQVLRIVARFFDDGDVYRVNDAACRAYRNAALSMRDETTKQEYLAKAQALQDDRKNYIVRIDAQQSFTKMTFIPSPDGGFYDLGLGQLLGPVNATVNTILNQMIDSGSLRIAGGGFLGRGVKMKGGVTPFDPGEWKPVDSTGDDLRKNIVPLPTQEPSMVMFQLLELLIGYGEKISGATDIMTGVSPGQNTPAETSRNTIEQGMKVFSGIYARMYRSFKRELAIRFRLNQLFLKSSPHWEELTVGDSAILAPGDYDVGPLRVFPSADPASVSEEQVKQKAGLVYQVSHQSPFMNKYLAEKQFLEANGVADLDELLPTPGSENAPPPPQNPKVELEKAKLAQDAKDADRQYQLDVAELQIKAEHMGALVQEILAKAQLAQAESEGVATGQQIAALNASVGIAREQQNGIIAAIKLLQNHRAMSHQEKQADIQNQAAANTAKSTSKLQGAINGAIPSAGTGDGQGMAGMGK